jgi:hypothetical protein
MMVCEPPSKSIGARGGIPLRVRVGKGPFDIIGYLLADARMIGCELKSSQQKNSLAIVQPKGDSAGLQYHQLTALAELAISGGIARVVWQNGGRIGVIGNSKIITAWRVYEEVLKSEASGRSVPLGAKSVPWEAFTPVDYTNLYGVVAIDWLRPDTIK